MTTFMAKVLYRPEQITSMVPSKRLSYSRYIWFRVKYYRYKYAYRLADYLLICFFMIIITF